MKRAQAGVTAMLVLVMAASATASAQGLAELMATATPVGEAVVFANDYVRVSYAVLEYPQADRRVAESRPVVVFVSVEPGPGILNTGLLLPPPRSPSPWKTGAVPRGIRIEALKPPPPPPPLGDPGTDLPQGAREDGHWEGGRLILATFESMHFAEGTGPYPSVTVFLSEGVVDVSHDGVRRRMGVRAGDAFWFEAATRIAVWSDLPVGVAIVQLYGSRRF